MDFFDTRSAFERFEAWTLAPQRAWPQTGFALSGDRRQSRQTIRRTAPRAPGVYGMVDDDGNLIYVGKSKSLGNRLLSYFTGAVPNKAQRIIAHTRRLLWEAGPDEFAALLRELELIRRWRPHFNVQGQPHRRRPAYLIVGRGPAAHVYLAAAPARGDTLVFGPVRPTRDCRRAVQHLNDHFQLCDCLRRLPEHFTDQRELFPAGDVIRCSRHALGNCLAPCAGGCSPAQYTDHVRAAKRFLRGTDLSALARLEELMHAAAAARRYEEAAVFRDARSALHELQEQLQRFRVAQRHYSFIYPVPGHHGGCTWYLLRHGQVYAACAEPHDRQTAEACLAAMGRLYTAASPATQTPREDVDQTLLVAAWFRSQPDELQRMLSPEAARQKLQNLCGEGRPIRGLASAG